MVGGEIKGRTITKKFGKTVEYSRPVNLQRRASYSINKDYPVTKNCILSRTSFLNEFPLRTYLMFCSSSSYTIGIFHYYFQKSTWNESKLLIFTKWQKDYRFARCKGCLILHSPQGLWCRSARPRQLLERYLYKYTLCLSFKSAQQLLQNGVLSAGCAYALINGNI